MDAVDAKGFWGHFDGSSVKPVASSPATDIELAAISLWEKNERSSKSLLTQKIPDSTLMKVHSVLTVQARWKLIVEEYTEKGAYAQTDLRSQFLDSKCKDNDNVREFLEALRMKREELTTVGVNISVEDYRSTIINAIPPRLSNFAATQLAAAKLGKINLLPDTLISLISEEFDRQKRQYSKRSGSKKAKDDSDEALSVGASGKSKLKKPRGVCWNCDEKGHFRNQCTKPAKDGSKDSKKSSGSANVACDSDSEGGGVFVAIASDSNGSWCSSDYDEDSEWFSEVEFSGATSNCSGSWVTHLDSDSEDESVGPVGTGRVDSDAPIASVTVSNPETNLRTELYDSGCTTHMTPYRDALENFSSIEPKSFRAANQQNFKAVGKGEMIVEVPNGVDTSELRLTEVLYSPEVGYTLISSGQLDKCGFQFSFGNGKCQIFAPDGEKMGEISQNSRGLYRHVTEKASVNSAIETLTLEQFHRRMGHISLEVSRKLVSNGFVTGVRLETTSSGDPFFLRILCLRKIHPKTNSNGPQR